MSSSRLVLVLFPLALLAANSFLVFANCDEASNAAELTARSRRSAKCYNDVDIAKYRNGLSSMFSFQNALREPSVGPRHVRQQPAKMDGFSAASTGAAAGAGGSGNVYWMSPDPNSPDLQAWTGVNGAAPAAGAPQSMGASATGGAVASSPSLSVNTYGIQQQQQPLSAQQPPSQQPQQQSMAMALPQQQQQVQQQQQQPISMMPMQYQQVIVMIYTLSECLPCQNAKRFLAVHYPDVRAHYLELSGNEPWQQQLQIDLQYLTGAITFPYIFVCGQYIGVELLQAPLNCLNYTKVGNCDEWSHNV
uniref:Glutaredoxin domain-containing protein n=1 Tax=Globodera pallida TaxID=36090 RepID=A0A183BWS4_GLOPA